MIKEKRKPAGIVAYYYIETDESENIFYFKVKQSEYIISFLECDILDGLSSYSIVIERDVKGVLNTHVAETIMTIIKGLLDADKVFCFTCDTNDGKQFARHRLFKRWFSKGEYAELYDMINMDSNEDLCGGVLIKKSHPNYIAYQTKIIDFKEQLEEYNPEKKIRIY